MTEKHSNRAQVQAIFNEMAEEYDNLADPWYRYTFSFIDQVLRDLVPPAKAGEVALDVGAGTGIQSRRLAASGYAVLGVDLAVELLRAAGLKLRNARSCLCVADAETLPVATGSIDVVNCCGPTLSFVPHWREALREMSRCLRPGGHLLLEVEGKWNLDLVWELLDGLGLKFLDYGVSLREALLHWKPPLAVGHQITYRFRLESGETVPMQLKLFTGKELRSELDLAGFDVEHQWGLHSVTNVFPSTVLHRANLSSFALSLFRGLSGIERRLNRFPPLRALGCSILVLARRR